MMDWTEMIKNMVMTSVNAESIAKFAYLQLKRKVGADFRAASMKHLDESGKYTMSDAEEILQKVLGEYQETIVDFVKAALKKKEGEE
jgi:hypothetical protein